MHIFGRDTHFALSIDGLVKSKSKKELRKNAKKLQAYVIEINSPSLAYRLATEFNNHNISTKKLQNLIINNADARYIFRFAYDIRDANIQKLQDAIIKYGDILQVAKFGCFIRGADKTLIENLIAKSDSAKSCYLYLRFVKNCDVEKLKSTVIRSKKPRYLYALIKKIKNKEDFNRIQDLILAGRSYLYIRLLGGYIKGADKKRVEERIISTGDMSEIKKLARIMKTPRLEKLSVLF